MTMGLMDKDSKGRKPHPPNQRRNNCTLTVIEAIRKGIPPSRIQEFSKRQIQYILRKLKTLQAIRKVGYGTWEILDESRISSGNKVQNGVQVHRVGGKHTPPEGTKPDSVRGHGIVVVLDIPKLRNWGKREQLLEEIRIPFLKIPQGQRISLKGVEKVWLCKGSIVFYLPFSWYGENARKVSRRIFQDVISLIQQLERKLRISSLKIQGRYKVKFARNHYALIKNGLAIEYNKPPRERLFVADQDGLWFLIDNSFNLHEAETVHPKTAVPDNMIVHNFLNSLKKNPVTPGEILDIIGKTAEQMKGIAEQDNYYRENIASHVKAIQEISGGIKRFSSLLERLEGGLNKQSWTARQGPLRRFLG